MLWFKNKKFSKIYKYPKKIKGYDLSRTCGACPEQYDVFYKKEQVGYLRLRHGEFTVSIPNCSANIIFRAEPKGNGMFEDNERKEYLTKAIEAIDKERRKK